MTRHQITTVPGTHPPVHPALAPVLGGDRGVKALIMPAIRINLPLDE